MLPEEIHKLLNEHKIGADNTFGISNIKTVCELAKLLPDKPTILEIGTMFGRSACAWALATGGRVWTIDKENRSGIVLENAKKLGLENIISINVGDSHTINWDRLADLVFIDGGHNYEDVMKDIQRFTRYAKYVICGHDYADDFFEVKRAVDDFFGGLNKSIQNFWIVKKSGMV